MKKVLSVCVPLVLLLAVLSLPVFANETADIVFSLGNVTGWAGGTVKVPLTVGMTETPYNAVGLALEYDDVKLPSGIEFVEFADYDATLAECYEMGPNADGAMEYLGDFDDDNKAIVLALDTDGNIGGKTICNLVFKIDENIEGVLTEGVDSLSVGLHAVVMNNSTNLENLVSVTSATITIGDAPEFTVTNVVTGANAPQYTQEGDIITVKHTTACVVGYEGADGKYVAIPAVANEDGSYSYTISDNVANVVIAVKGDLSGDGKLSAQEARYTLQAAGRIITLDALQFFAADVNSDGKLSAQEARYILQAAARLITLPW